MKSREQKVVNIMMTLFDDEYILKSYVKSKEKEATKEVARTMYDTGDSLERIAQVFKMSIKEVEEWLELEPV